MSKNCLVAIAADVETAIQFSNVVTQTRRNQRRREKVDLWPGNWLCCPELHWAWTIRRWRWRRKKFRTALHAQYSLVGVCVVPHESRLEIVVIAMPMHRAQCRHAEQKAWECIQQVVVEQQCLKPLAECQSIRKRLVLQLVACECQMLQIGHTTNVSWNMVEVIVLQRQPTYTWTFENLKTVCSHDVHQTARKHYCYQTHTTDTLHSRLRLWSSHKNLINNITNCVGSSDLFNVSHIKSHRL